MSSTSCRQLCAVLRLPHPRDRPGNKACLRAGEAQPLLPSASVVRHSPQCRLSSATNGQDDKCKLVALPPKPSMAPASRGKGHTPGGSPGCVCLRRQRVPSPPSHGATPATLVPCCSHVEPLPGVLSPPLLTQTAHLLPTAAQMPLGKELSSCPYLNYPPPGPFCMLSLKFPPARLIHWGSNHASVSYIGKGRDDVCFICFSIPRT